MTANTLTVRTAYMVGLNLGRWHRDEGWSGAVPFSTRPALQAMRRRVEPYGHLGQHLMGLAYNAANELNDSMTGQIKVPVHGAETQPLAKFDYTHMFETIARARECGANKPTGH